MRLPAIFTALVAIGNAGYIMGARVENTATKKKTEIVLDIHMCSAQPFLEKYVDRYGKACSDPDDPMHWVVEMWDGSILSRKEFLETVIKNKKYSKKGTWKVNNDRTRINFSPIEKNKEGALDTTISLVLRQPTDFECAITKMMDPNDKTLNIEKKTGFSLGGRQRENEKDVDRIKEIVRQIAGLSMLSAAQAEAQKAEDEGLLAALDEESSTQTKLRFDYDMLQAWKMLDIYDTSYKDSLWTKLKNRMQSKTESSLGRQLFKTATDTAACAIGVYTQTGVSDCTEVLSTVASYVSAKLGFGNPATYRIRSMVAFVTTYLDTLKDLVNQLAARGDASAVRSVVDTATSQVQCVLQLFSAYFDFKSPVTIEVDGKQYQYNIALGRPERGFLSDQLHAYNFKQNIELTKAMIAELQQLLDILGHTVQLLELEVKAGEMAEKRWERGARGRRNAILPGQFPLLPLNADTSGSENSGNEDSRRHSPESNSGNAAEKGLPSAPEASSQHLRLRRRKHWPIDGRLNQE